MDWRDEGLLISRAAARRERRDRRGVHRRPWPALRRRAGRRVAALDADPAARRPAEPRMVGAARGPHRPLPRRSDRDAAGRGAGRPGGAGGARQRHGAGRSGVARARGPSGALSPRRAISWLGWAAIRTGGPCYALWELLLLSELGFGIDLSSLRGDRERPRTWSGCRRDRGAPSAATPGRPGRTACWHCLTFLRAERADRVGPDALADALALTGHFLETRLAPTLPREALPAARARAAAAIVKLR